MHTMSKRLYPANLSLCRTGRTISSWHSMPLSRISRATTLCMIFSVRWPCICVVSDHPTTTYPHLSLYNTIHTATSLQQSLAMFSIFETEGGICYNTLSLLLFPVDLFDFLRHRVILYAYTQLQNQYCIPFIETNNGHAIAQ